MKTRLAKILSIVLVLFMMLTVLPQAALARVIDDNGTTVLSSWFDRWWDIFFPRPDPKPSYPAQTMSYDSHNGTSVYVDAPEGALPANTALDVLNITDIAAVQSAFDAASSERGHVYAALDINFLDQHKDEVEPRSAVTVTLDNAIIPQIDDLSLVHFKGSASELGSVEMEFIEDFYISGSTISFEAEDFSVYAVIGDGTTDAKLLTVEFYSTDGTTDTIINTQVIRMSQIAKLDAPVFDPGVPSITTTQSFEGWSRNKNYATLENDRSYSVDQINSYIKRTYSADSDSTILKYYAKVYNVRYIVYHDQAGAVLMTQAYHVANPSSTESVKIDYSYVGFMGGQNFSGWVTEDKVEVAGDYPLYKDDLDTIYQNGVNYNLNETLSLYPYLNSGNWLTFNNNIDQDADTTSASYTSPVFYADGENTVAPATPVRVGYQFDGWYWDQNLTDRFIFGSPINEDITVYAKWTPKNTTYHVVFWTQKVTDEPGMADGDKSYDFYDAANYTALTGSSVSINIANSGTTADNRLGYNSDSSIGKLGYYFIYNGTNTDTDSVVVKGDGSTTLNVYYDRKVITFKYYTDENCTTLWTPTGDYVPATNGAYYYYEEQFESGYYLIGWDGGAIPDYQPSEGDTCYYYETYSSSGTWALPDFDDMTKFYTSPKSDGGSHVMSESNDYYYFDSDHTNTFIWDAGSSYTYRYRPLFYKYTAYETGYYAVGTGPRPTAAGTHNISGGVGSNTISGLYGAQLGEFDWPYAGSGYVWANKDGSSAYNYPLALTEYVPILSSPAVEVKFYLADDTGSLIHVWYVGQELGGTAYNVPLTDGYTRLSTSSTTRQWIPNETIQGFEVVGYRFGTSGSWTTATVDTEIQLPTSTSGGELYIAFKRLTYKFSFYSNSEDVTPDNLPSGIDLNAVPFDYDLAAFMSATPTNGPEGCYFDGWYADPSLNTPFEFDATMPANNIRVYAKWTVERFRVVCDPTSGENIPASDIVFPGNQATTFRVDYGEVVQGSSLNNAQRDGYTLLGWFLDPEFTIPFNFGQPITDEVADMSYADAEDSERQGDDPWNINEETGNPLHYSDVGRDNVRGKVTIYAKWRQNPDGIIGFNVHYNATDKNGNTGKFSDNTTEWNDPNIYADGAMAFGQPASTPDNDDLQFLYWEILDKNNNVVGKAYPGQLWEIDVDFAKVTDLNAQAVYYTFGDKRPDEGKKASEPELPTRDGTKATHTYRKVTTLTPGKRYLISYTEGSTAYIMTNTHYSGNYRPRITTAAVSNNTVTGSFDDYLFGIEYNSNYGYRFGSLSKIDYLSSTGSSNYYAYIGYDSSYPNRSYWTLTSAGKLQNYSTDRYLGYSTNNTNSPQFFTTFSSASDGDVITFYELVEEEITGQEFEQTNDLQVGGRYIIAIGDYAVGNEALNSSSDDHFIKGIRVKAQTSSVIVPTSDVDNATWEIVSGSASEGYVFKNVGNGTYLGMSSDGQCYLAATTEALASHWTYDNGTDLNNHVTESANYNSSSGKYYYYLSFSGAFIDFTTSTGSGQGVKLYGVSKSYTVTFKDGRTNAVIEVQQVAEGENAVPPEAPDHSDTGWIFTGWDTDYTNVTENITVTAQYVNQSTLSYTVTFRYMNSAGEWVSESQTVQHGQAATAPTVPTPPSGYTFNSWDKKYNNITSNLTVNAVYKQVATRKFTIDLRAVYGRANTTATTHIYWYANNDESLTTGGDLQKNEGLAINQAITIPTPTSFSYTTGRGTESGLVWEDHIFLGWARIDNETGANITGDAHPELNEDDLFLAWDPASGDYIVKKKIDNIDDVALGEHVTKVAADETHPYHDMYAVWATVFYVYHSGTNTVEKIVTTTKGSTTYNLAEKTSAGYLYGGYYTEYAGVSNNYDTKTSINWNENQAIWKSDNTLDLEAMCDSGVDTGTGAKKYNGSNVKWDSTKAYTAENGLAITPVAGTTYYIKEVPAAKYLRPYLHYTYYEVSSDPKPIATAWLISDVDDLNYQQSGFVIIDGSNAAQIIRSLTVQTQHGDTTETLTAARLFGARGYLSYLTVINDGRNGEDPVHMLASGNLVAQYWVTPDGLMVTGTAVRTYSNLDSTLISADTTEGSSSITVFSSGN